MSELSRLVDWLRRLESLATCVAAWRLNSSMPFSNAAVIAQLERQIGWNLVEVV